MQQDIASLWRRTGIAAGITLLLCVIVTLLAGDPTPQITSASAPTNAPRGLLFLRNPQQTAELWVADADGLNQQQIITNVTSFSPSLDGQRIAISTQPVGMPSKIDVLDAISGDLKTIVWSQDYLAFNPMWSPASGPGVVAYERRAVNSDGLGAPHLWLVDEQGTDLGAVVRGGDVVTYGGVWSPDGTRLAFTDPLRSEIIIFNFSDQLRRIPLNGDFDWSPDGTKLVVSVLKSDRDFSAHLVIYDLTNDTETVVFEDANASDYTPRWSPDGTQIAFVRRDNALPRGTIWVGDLATGNVQAVTTSPDGLTDDADPQWAPDSQTLTWTRLTIGTGAGGTPVPAALWRYQRGASAELFIENAMQGRWFR